MNEGLTREQVELRATVREVAEREIAPAAEELDREARFPYEIIATLGGLGLMGMTVPEELGGAGLDTLSYTVAIEELARVDSSVAVTVAAHTGLGTMPIVLYGDDGQRRRWVPDLAAGRRLGAIGLTEPEAGSDAGACRTRAAARPGGGWRIDGEKMFITSSGTDITACCTVTAREDDGRVSCFIVPADAPGYRPGPPLRKIGWRASDTRPVHLDGVELGPEARLGPAGAGMRQVLGALDGGRIAIAAIGVGLAQGAFELALEHARNRRQFGRPIVGFQAIQFGLAEIATEIAAGRSLLYAAARAKDEGGPVTKLAAMAKLTAGRLAQTVAERSLHIHGGYGWMEETPIARLYRDAKILEIGEGTSEVQKMVIARAIGAHE
ncbi:MAG TPA: acyl-CoA dehydrogenase family protein [Miltoncostaeaceae bacterium]|jgi:alkylation response protein AidB-like acyl-CoA dehydrogenase|nr:acyl-CoA dehydrogenase family protein [Miltoncostaeaceae bacterium]